MRSALRIPWDVPARVVPAPSGTRGDRTVRTVDPGVELPGVAGVRVTTVEVDGVPHLARIDPVDSADGPDDGSLGALLAQMRDGTGAVPVLVDGTPFTWQVLDTLARVPSGERITYAGLAHAAGRPGAVRATASVMARNHVPLVLPCHRVVPSSGGPGRHRWGAAVKVALLDAEASS